MSFMPPLCHERRWGDEGVAYLRMALSRHPGNQTVQAVIVIHDTPCGCGDPEADEAAAEDPVGRWVKRV
jgi:hypothetical protein